ncbi:uncharacterized protein LOC129289558 isoform X2 [Prosopis cineraria]|uniref:uncharacterized protein LOC129289558 isoform X2 n=1 Tax=Prosopis cineraria TaxID=364024 RepID=UPI00240F8E7B|nr:uncharacterized protein LOC129289558 isoform X2 [Prosopis cineraria]
MTLKKSKSTAILCQEVVSLYQRFSQLDRNAKGFISADEFLSVPDFATSPLSQVYDSDRHGKVSFKHMVEVLKDLSAPFISDEQREVLGQSNPRIMYVEAPVG